LSEQVFLNFVGSILTLIFGILAGFVGNYFKEAKNVKQVEAVAKVVDIAEAQIQSKRGLAYDAVMFVEDAYKSLNGKDKLAKAINWAVDAGQAHGLNLTAAGIEGFVRAQYNVMKLDLQKVVPENYSVITPAIDLTPVDADSEPVAPVVTANPVVTDDQTACRLRPFPAYVAPVAPVEVAPVEVTDVPLADMTAVVADDQIPVDADPAVPAVNPDIRAQLSQALVKMNVAQAEYNQLMQQVTGS